MSLMDAAGDSRRRVVAHKDGAAAILVGVDGSRTSRRAAAYATGLARRQRSRLIVAHIVKPPACSALSPISVVPALDAAIGMSDALRRELLDEVSSADVSIEFVTARGDTCGELQRIAAKYGAELLVVGASESPWHRLIGSLPGRLIRSRQIPVIVVP